MPTTWGSVGSAMSMMASTWSLNSGSVDRGIGVAAADIPDPVRPDALGRHERDLARRLGMRDVEDADARGELACP